MGKGCPNEQNRCCVRILHCLDALFAVLRELFPVCLCVCLW